MSHIKGESTDEQLLRFVGELLVSFMREAEIGLKDNDDDAIRREEILQLARRQAEVLFGLLFKGRPILGEKATTGFYTGDIVKLLDAYVDGNEMSAQSNGISELQRHVAPAKIVSDQTGNVKKIFGSDKNFCGPNYGSAGRRPFFRSGARSAASESVGDATLVLLA